MSGIDNVVLCRQVILSAKNKTAYVQKGVVFIFSIEILYPPQRALLNFLLFVPSVCKSLRESSYESWASPWKV